MMRSERAPGATEPASLLPVALPPLPGGRSASSRRAVNRDRRGRLILLCTLPVMLGAPLPALPVPAAAQSPEAFFETRVRPVLVERCYSCHGPLRQGELRLDSREALLEGGASGPAIVPGDPDASLLIRNVRHEIEGQEMPQDGDPLSAHQIEGLVEWIGMGAPWPVAVAEAGGEAGGGAGLTVTAMGDEGLTPGARIFVDQVRPVLERSCFACHTEGAPSGLRLDSREGMLEGGSRGPALIPGNPEESLLVAALRHERDDLRMPQDAPRLSDAEIRAFVDWIQAGAEWAEDDAPLAIPRRAVTEAERGFWSFRPLARPEVPGPRSAGSARADGAHADIDRFVLAKLDELGLEPLPPADRRQLIRRATFDLTGLPPTPEEVEAFVNDSSPDAFGKVVERLLDSPHYGERWGRHWLDVARFGEDDTRGLAQGGSGHERYPSAYVHRDWVVEAFNEDMPYDLFVRAQLAGDLLDEPERTEAIGGLGFLGGGPWYYDIANPPVARADERHDRVDVTTRGFLGLTVACARCHDHKYDPIGTHDYYALAGIFNNSDYYEYPVAEADSAAAYKKDQEFIEGLEESLQEYLNTEGEQLARVLSLQVTRYMMAAWQVTGKPQMPVEQAAARAKVDLETLQRWVRFLGKEPRHYPFLEEWQAMIAGGDAEEDEARELAEDFQRLVLEIVAEQEELEERNQRIIARGTPLEEVKSTPMPNGFESFFDRHQLELETMERERFNLYQDIFRRDLDNQLDTFFPAPGLFRFRDWSLERQLGRVAMDHVTAMRERIEELEEELPDLPFVMGVRDKEPGELTDISLHIRGSPTNLGEAVPRGFLAVLAPEGDEAKRAAPFSEGSGRRALAEAIASHPITARVIVNRVWRWHMGSGIVETPSNFGFQGDPPSNPALLEYLAAGFVEGGRSIKQLHRDIMLSATYQRASGRHAANEQVDGANRYYWRYDRRRLDAESIRDAILAVSGDLDAEVGGPSLDLDDEENDRRTIYGRVSRFQVDEYLQTFDFPNPSLSAERRYTTNVPAQSLYFMNSPFVRRQAELLVDRLLEEAQPSRAVDEAGPGSGDGPEEGAGNDADNGAAEGDGDRVSESSPVFHDREMIEAAYPLLYGRESTEPEIAAGLAFLEERRADFLEEELEKLASEAEEEETADDDEAEAPDDEAEAPDDEGAAPDDEATDESEAGDAVDEAQATEGDTDETAGDGDETADEGDEAEATDGEAEDESEAGDAVDEAERRASVRAWIQYTRALFSTAEFRFVG